MLKNNLLLITATILIIFNTHLNAVEVNQDIHYIGKTVFPISGTSFAKEGDCVWEVTGGVTLILSFSRSTSLATFFVTHKLTSPAGNELCPGSIFDSNFTFPLTVNVEERTFFATSPEGERSIQGNLFSDRVEGQYRFQSAGVIDSSKSNWSGSFSTQLKEVPGEFINVSQISGEVISTIPLGTSQVKDSIPDASTLITGETGRATLQEKFGSKITLNPKTILTRLPIKSFAEKEQRTLILARGRIDTSISTRERDYKVVTPVGTIELTQPNSNRRAGDDSQDSTEFSAQYSQIEQTGELSVTVVDGSLEVTDAENNTTTVTGGEEYTFSAQTNQTTWVQPADGGLLYGGVENTLGWTVYPNASSYLMEYNFPNPRFSDDNPQVPEFIEQSIMITADMYEIFEGLVVLNMLMPELPDSMVEARVFPLDEAGEIMGQSVSSDRTTLTFQ